MNDVLSQSPPVIIWIGLAAVFGVAAGLVFAGWMRFGPEIVLTFSESGLSMCL